MALLFTLPDKNKIVALRQEGQVAFSPFSVNAALTALSTVWISEGVSKVFKLSEEILKARTLEAVRIPLSELSAWFICWMFSLCAGGLLLSFLQTKFLFHFGLLNVASGRPKTSFALAAAFTMGGILRGILGVLAGIAIAYLTIPISLSLLREPFRVMEYCTGGGNAATIYVVLIAMAGGVVSFLSSKVFFLIRHFGDTPAT